MIKVNVVSYDSEGKETVIATITGNGSSIKFKGDEWVKDHIKRGIHYGKKKYTLKDGEEFVKMIEKEFHGSRVRAYIVK